MLPYGPSYAATKDMLFLVQEPTKTKRYWPGDKLIRVLLGWVMRGMKNYTRTPPNDHKFHRNADSN